MAVFFPSFDYLSVVWTHWKSTGLLTRLEAIKKVFKEPRQSAQLSQVMQAYTEAIAKPSGGAKGACIACVIGGKLSEGINFNDDLARGVVIVGLPYPNIHSVLVS